MVVVRI